MEMAALNGIPFAHVFKTPGNMYVYDGNTNIIFQINQLQYNYLKEIEEQKYYPKDDAAFTEEQVIELQNWIGDLQSKGILKPCLTENIIHYADRFLDQLLDSCIPTICLQITQNCNLRCEYCVYSGKYITRGHSQTIMGWDTAKMAIDFLIDHSREASSLHLSFYGGEPLLRFDFIKKCVDYFENAAMGKRISCAMTTNGTLLDEEKIRYLVDKKFQLSISIDGPKEIHDMNRKTVTGEGSFDKVMNNLKLMRKISPEYLEKSLSFITLLETRGNFCELANFLASYRDINEDNIMPTTVSRENLKDKSIFDNENERNYFDDLFFERYKYYLYKWNRVDGKNVYRIIKTMEDREIDSTEATLGMKTYGFKRNFHPSGPCITGLKKLFVNAHGELYPCERVSESSPACRIGTLEKGFDLDKTRKFLNIGKLTEEECKHCWASMFCFACGKMADNGEILDKESKLSYCDDIKASAEDQLKNYFILKEFKLI